MTVRVVLWRVSASESFAEVAKVEGCAFGVLSMAAMMREVSLDAGWG